MLRSRFFSFLILVLLVSLNSSMQKEKSVWQPYFEMIRPEFTGDLAYKTTAYVEQFWRVAGNTGFNNTVFRIAAELEKAGYIFNKID